VVNFAFEREVLDARIQQRTRALIIDPKDPHSEGPWLLEVRRLLSEYGDDFGGLSASRAIGYREIAVALWDASAQRQRVGLSQDKITEICDRIVTLTRQYSRRQSTWMASASVDATLRLPSDVLDFADSFVRAHCR
jgi:tRNA A37 N6-isopentenylltransferase MiaA